MTYPNFICFDKNEGDTDGSAVMSNQPRMCDNTVKFPVSSQRVRFGLAQELPVYKFAGVHKKVNKPKPLAVGDVVKDGTGRSIRIICVDRDKSFFLVIGLTTDGDMETYTAHGKFSLVGTSQYDLVLPTTETVEFVPAVD